jgi:hypothetical protein
MLTSLPFQGYCCHVCKPCRRTALHLHQDSPGDHVCPQRAHPVYDQGYLSALRLYQAGPSLPQGCPASQAHMCEQTVKSPFQRCQLFGFADASWADDKPSRRSTLCCGGARMINNGYQRVYILKLALASILALSTSEAALPLGLSGFSLTRPSSGTLYLACHSFALYSYILELRRWYLMTV